MHQAYNRAGKADKLSLGAHQWTIGGPCWPPAQLVDRADGANAGIPGRDVTAYLSPSALLFPRRRRLNHPPAALSR